MTGRSKAVSLLLTALMTAVVVGGSVTAASAAVPTAVPKAVPAAIPAAVPNVVSAAGAKAARCCHITIPSNYVYNPNTTKQKTLHDYCSHSPDEFPSPGTNANFRGPCARHDLCYQYHQKSQLGCDNQLGSQLTQECTYTYGTFDPRRAACKKTAQVYWAAVVIHTLWP